MSDEQVYNYQGHHVVIVGGQRKISDRGTRRVLGLYRANPAYQMTLADFEPVAS